MVKSAGGLLGLSGGPQAPDQYNGGLDQLNQMNAGSAQGGDILNQYAQGNLTADQAMQQGQDRWGSADPFANLGFQNALASGATTGSKFATDQVQNNPILGSLFGKGGQLEGAENRLNDLQNQGFELKPEDMTLYGQTSGNIARMFGSQGNQISQDLANRGLASAPSGAAGAMFSGLNGNQNEMLAQAQQQIMQQRVQNTLQQIGQQQQMVQALGAQAGNDINQQYGRQLSGSQNQTQNEQSAGQMGHAANWDAMQAANFNVENTPTNLFDMVTPYGAAKGIGMAMGGGGNAKTQGTPGAGTDTGGGGAGFGADSYGSSGMAGGGTAKGAYSLFG